MENIEKIKRAFLGQIGEGELQILKDSGIDVDAVATSIIKRAEEDREIRVLQAEFPTVNDIMTSELCYKSQKGVLDRFGEEYDRRLRLIGFSDGYIGILYQQELAIASAGSMKEARKGPWVMRYFITHASAPEDMPKPEELTLSELILISDDANSAFWRDRRSFPDKAIEALCIAATMRNTEGRYLKAFNERTKRMGWSKEQGNAYMRNECMLTERLKWGYPGYPSEPAWTEETTNLADYRG